VWPSHSQISSLSTAILALGKAKSRREPNLGCGEGDKPGLCDTLQKRLHESCRIGRRIVVMNLICLLSQGECDVTQYTSSVNGFSLPIYHFHERVTVHGCTVRVSSDWLPSYRFSSNSEWPDIFRTALVDVRTDMKLVPF
jgi:hypothetical protein